MDDHNRVVPDHLCVGEGKEVAEKECNRFPCPRWVYGHWSEVSCARFVPTEAVCNKFCSRKSICWGDEKVLM